MNLKQQLQIKHAIIEYNYYLNKGTSMSHTAQNLNREEEQGKGDNYQRKNSFYTLIHQENHIQAALYEDIIQEVMNINRILQNQSCYQSKLEPKIDCHQEQLAADSTQTILREKQGLGVLKATLDEQNIIDNEVKVKIAEEQQKSPYKCEKAKEMRTGFSAKDQTKNIPKNFIKAIFAFIIQNPIVIKKLLFKKKEQLNYLSFHSFMEFVIIQRNVMKFTIARMKELWMDHECGNIMRIISSHFLRKRSLAYILNSKIGNKFSHIKYRLKLLQSIANPADFVSIK